MKAFVTTLKIAAIAMAAAAIMSSCNKEDDNAPDLYVFDVVLSFPDGMDPFEGINVKASQSNGSGVYESSTDTEGIASFILPAGIYNIVASGVYPEESQVICNASRSGVIVGKNIFPQATIPVTVSIKDNSLIIKEVYCGGVMKDDNSAAFNYDKYITIYNNSAEDYISENLAITMAPYYNAEANTNSKLYTGDVFNYATTDFFPAMNGIWYFQGSLTIPAFSEIVVNIHGAINNTQTVTNSVNFANADYYCMYDPDYEGPGTNATNKYYNNTNNYPSPAEVIPTSHYLKTVKLGQGNAWPFSITSPAVYIYQTSFGTTPKDAAENAANAWMHDGYNTPAFGGCKVNREWIVDGVEVWNSEKISTSWKRLTDDIDAGHIAFTSKLGHSVYRNVDKEATEALPENAGKLVYGYSLGNDPSGIDAEASIKKGAHIIFADSNNSSNDFHEREKCALRGE